MYPAGSCNLRRIPVMRRERDRKYVGSEISAGTLRIKGIEFVDRTRIKVNFKVCLIVGNVSGLRSNVVVRDQPVRRRSIRRRIEAWVGSKELRHWAHDRNLVVGVRCKVVLRIVKL